MIDEEMRVISASCENDARPLLERKTHEEFVTLGTVNNGRKNFVNGARTGSQSTVITPPVNGTSGDDKAAITGETSSTETAKLSKTMGSDVIGSTNLKDQYKSLAGITDASDGSWMNVVDHLELLNVAFTDTTEMMDALAGFLTKTNKILRNGKDATIGGPIK